uniref:Uncharacterized protein n=1 Tax=Amblyomma maculatum TaxID=34609 RepID=G3MT17_AMBMU
MSGEPSYHLIEQPAMLVIAKAILVQCREALQSCWTADWWSWRCTYIHQLVMLDRSYELYNEICQRIADVECQLPSNVSVDEKRKLAMMFYIEAAVSYVHYCEVKNSRSYLEKAKNISNLEFRLTGALGKRTYHQEIDLPQLLLEVRHKSGLDGVSTSLLTEPNHFPRNVALKDDTVMNEIKFSADAPTEVFLAPEESCLLLSACILSKSISAPDALRDEEIMAYLEQVLSVPSAWSVQFSALFQRCRLECKSTRRVERSMTQLQCLVDAVKSPEPSVAIRQVLYFSAAKPSIWEVENSWEPVLCTGCNEECTGCFVKYELWEDVISCYTKIGHRDRAEQIVRKLLEKEETAHLYCLLGDATQNPEHYTKAWELSGHSSARAQRSLGLFYYNKKEFHKAIPFLEKSAELNGVQLNVWFALGYSAMQVESYALSVKAYKRVVALDPESLEAWNNMASAYIHMGDKPKAWRVLQEALKCSYDNWRVWENYLLVCMDVGAFDECINSWHRLIDIKGKHSDGKIAKLLVRVVAEGIPDIHGQPGSYLKPKLLELFGRVTSGVTNDADIWYSYGSLYQLSSEDPSTTVEDIERMLQFFQRSFRCHNQKQSWEKDVITCREHLVRSRNLLDIYVSATKSLRDPVRKRQLLSSARITVNGALSIVQNYKVNYTHQILEELTPAIDSLVTKVEEVTSLVNSMD